MPESYEYTSENNLLGYSTYCKFPESEYQKYLREVIGMLIQQDEAQNQRGDQMSDIKEYSLRELADKMEPEYRRTQEFMKRCMVGLSHYAMQYKLKNRSLNTQKEIAKLRSMISEMSGYWGMEDLELQYLEQFDRLQKEDNQMLYQNPSILASETIRGLYQYSIDLVGSQGDDAIPEIERNRDLIQEIADFWDIYNNGVDQMYGRMNEELDPLYHRRCIHYLTSYASELSADLENNRGQIEDIAALVGYYASYNKLEGNNTDSQSRIYELYQKPIESLLNGTVLRIDKLDANQMESAVDSLRQYSNELLDNHDPVYQQEIDTCNLLIEKFTAKLKEPDFVAPTI